MNFTKSKIYDNLENAIFLGTRIMLLIFHVLLLGVFVILNKPLMVVVSAISVFIYLLLLLFTTGRPGEFAITLYTEVILYTLFGVFSMGWEYGFQFYLIAVIPGVFYFAYLMRKLRYRWTYNPIILAITNAVLYMLLRGWWLRKVDVFVTVDADGLAVAITTLNEIVTLVSSILFMAMYHDTTEGHEKELSTDAETDQLTGLSNRRTMLAAMDKAERLAIKKGQPMAAAIIDIDNFKHVNDTYGHDVGDIVLKTLAAEIKEMQQSYLSACRWGGEEFVFLCVGGRAYEDLLDEMNKLLRKMSAKVIEFAPGHSLQVTITCGIALAVTGESSNALIKRADDYLYYGKMHGKNQVVTEIVFKRGGGNGPKSEA